MSSLRRRILLLVVVLLALVTGYRYLRREPVSHSALRAEGVQIILADPAPPEPSSAPAEPAPARSAPSNERPCEPNDPMCGGL